MFRQMTLWLMACLSTIGNVNAEADAPIPAWVERLAPLRTGDVGSFQFRAEVHTRAEQLIAYVSWSPPDRRCVILADAIDGLPLMVAVDGRVWLYDPIGGQILLIRAEPEFHLAQRGDRFQMRWGMRADFPDLDSLITLRVDPAAMIRSLSRGTPEGLSVDQDKRTATFKHADTEFVLTITDGATPRPRSFTCSTGSESRFMKLSLDTFRFEDPVPAWHRPIDRMSLPKALRVAVVADAATWHPDAQARLKKVQGLLAGGGLFILRPALRQIKLRRDIEENSPIKLDFDEIRANDEWLRDTWRKALLDQRIELPGLTPTTKPASAEKL